VTDSVEETCCTDCSKDADVVVCLDQGAQSKSSSAMAAILFPDG